MAGSRQSVRFIAVVTVLLTLDMIPQDKYDYLRRKLQFSWPWMSRGGIPSVNLFMSFPNSGSRYALTTLQSATQRSAASFYGKEYIDADGVSLKRDESVLAYNDLTSGPYLTSNLDMQSSGKMLTRTYCGGHCLSHCTCEEYDITVEDFKRECTLTEDADASIDYLDESIIGSTVVLIRNPFDNIVGRFHYEYRLYNGEGSNSHFTSWQQDYVKDHNGFREWCAFIDDANELTEGQCFADDPTLLALMEETPCHSEFYKYVHWYNNAFELLDQLGSDKELVYHEDFFTNIGTVTNDLANFLDVTADGVPYNFEEKDYTYFYTAAERTKILQLIEHIATDTTRHHMRRYILYPIN